MNNVRHQDRDCSINRKLSHKTKLHFFFFNSDVEAKRKIKKGGFVLKEKKKKQDGVFHIYIYIYIYIYINIFIYIYKLKQKLTKEFFAL